VNILYIVSPCLTRGIRPSKASRSVNARWTYLMGMTVEVNIYTATATYCDMHACLRPLLSNGPRSTVNSGNAC
jgi:hypothetical protein